LDLAKFGDGYSGEKSGYLTSEGKLCFSGDWGLTVRQHAFDRTGPGDCFLGIELVSGSTRRGQGIHLADQANRHPWTTIAFGTGINFYKFHNLDPAVKDVTLKLAKAGNTFKCFRNEALVDAHTLKVPPDAKWFLKIWHVQYGRAQARAKVVPR
jgi:hypothetical protein